MNSFASGSTVLLVVLLGTTWAQSDDWKITFLETKTATGNDAGMTFGNVDIEIINRDFDLCKISNLDGKGDDFRPGAIDTFEDNELEECRNFPLPGGEVGLLRLTHSGLDAWTPEWIRVFNTNGSYAQCFDGIEIDDSEVHDLHCTLM